MRKTGLKAKLAPLMILSASLILTGCALNRESCSVTKPIMVKGDDYNRVDNNIDLTPVGTQRILDYVHDLENCAMK